MKRQCVLSVQLAALHEVTIELSVTKLQGDEETNFDCKIEIHWVGNNATHVHVCLNTHLHEKNQFPYEYLTFTSLQRRNVSYGKVHLLQVSKAVALNVVGIWVMTNSNFFISVSCRQVLIIISNSLQENKENYVSGRTLQSTVIKISK